MSGATPLYGIRYPTFGDVGDAVWQRRQAEDIDRVLRDTQLLVTAQLTQPQMRLQADFNQSVTQNVDTTMQWLESDDTDGMFDASVSLTNVTVRTAGVYLFTVAGCSLENVGTDTFSRYALFLNAVRRSAASKFPTTTSGTPAGSIAILLPCAVGDVLTVKYFYLSATTPANLAGGEFCAHRICPL